MAQFGQSDIGFQVPRGRLELPWVAPLAPKASASTNFAISAATRTTNFFTPASQAVPKRYLHIPPANLLPAISS